MGQAGNTWMQAAAGAASSAIGIGIQRLGANYDRRKQMQSQRELTEIQKQAEKEMMDYQQQKELEMWEKTGYGAQVKQMKEAGINPGLMYGMGGGGGQTTGHGGSPSIGVGTAPYIDTTGMGIQKGLELALLASQKNVLDTQATKNTVEAEKIGGVDTENVKADTANKIVDQVVKDYTGKELKSEYERVREPNRSQEMKTMSDELSARQGIAGTIYEMWQEGKLKEKSVAEVESVLLNNAKTRAEKSEIMLKMDMLEQNIKGAKLDNIIKELETKLQTETGIDKNSPAWLKIIGRLFVQLLNK